MFYAAGKSPIVPNGIVAQLTGVREEAELQVSTYQGNFSIELRRVRLARR